MDFEIPNFSCDVIHTSNNNFNIDDGSTHCFNFDGTVQNINNGNIVVLGDREVTFNNITQSKGSFINLGSVTLLNDFEIKNGNTFENFNSMSSKRSLIVSGDFDNKGDVEVSQLKVNGSGELNNFRSIITNQIFNDNIINTSGSIVSDYTNLNGSAVVNLINTTFTSNIIYSDGLFLRTDECSGIVSDDIRGNVQVSEDLICDGSCSCSTSSFEVVWGDGFVGSERNDLPVGDYSFDITEDGIIISNFDVTISEQKDCDVPLQDYFVIYPNPKMNSNEDQNLELSLTEFSVVKVEIYNVLGTYYNDGMGLYNQGHIILHGKMIQG